LNRFVTCPASLSISFRELFSGQSSALVRTCARSVQALVSSSRPSQPPPCGKYARIETQAERRRLIARGLPPGFHAATNRRLSSRRAHRLGANDDTYICLEILYQNATPLQATISIQYALFDGRRRHAARAHILSPTKKHLTKTQDRVPHGTRFVDDG
jgi:hypothetical protein